MSKFKVGGVLKDFSDMAHVEISPTDKHPYSKIVRLLYDFGYVVDTKYMGDTDDVDSISVWFNARNYDAWSVPVVETHKVKFKTLKALLEYQKSLED